VNLRLMVTAGMVATKLFVEPGVTLVPAGDEGD
jgi:hypothetical protein